MEGAPEKSEFLEVFYDRYMDVLVASVSGDREIGSAATAAAAAKQRQQQQAAAAAAAAATAPPGGDGQGQQQAAAAEGGGEQQLAAPAAAGGAKGVNDPSSLLPAGPVPASTIGLIVDLLCYCVQHHQVRV
jgi:hypothetical protein